MKPVETEKRENRLFPLLLAVCALLLGALVFAALYLLFHAGVAIYRNALIAAGLIVAAFALTLGLGVASAAVSLRTRTPLSPAGRFLLRRALALYPAALALGAFLRIPRDDVQASYVRMNNRLVRSRRFALAPEEIVVLAPHCLQKSACEKRVTLDADNCGECGGCDIAGLKRLCRGLGVNLAVATGGTLARSRVRALSPRAVVAVACERDLSSGIMDIYPLPGLGVKNVRPDGPCVNTRVDVSAVEEAVRFFLKSGGSPIHR